MQASGGAMMPSPSWRAAAIAVLVAAAGAVAPIAAAQSDFPNKPLRIVVANTPGSTVDLVARHLGERLTATLGQPFVIVNQPGAGGIVGAQTIAQAPKDGYTLGFYGNTAVIVPHLQKSLAFDPIKDITTVAIVGSIPFVAVVPRDSPYKDLAQLIAAAKRSPGSVTMGSAGNGTAIHLAAMQFQSMAGIDLLHVPYKGVAPLQTALLAGEVDVAFPTVGSVAPMIKEGRLRALGTTGRQRAPVLPQVPTIAEAGVPGYEFESWLALVAPAGVPAPILRKLGDDVRAVVAGEATQKLFAENSITPDVVIGDAAQRIVVRDFDVMGALVRKSGAVAN
jgi:tripartite-type tricarboxylate transporter receptor subunit TctC